MNEAEPWRDALRAAALLATDPVGLGGAVLRGARGAAGEHWLTVHTGLAGASSRRVPAGVDEAMLLGGVDLVASLATGRPVAEQGLLARADGGILLAPLAERLRPGAVACLCAALDHGEVIVERTGLARRDPARILLLAFDEGTEDERIAPALDERLAFALDLSDIPSSILREVIGPGPSAEAVAAARTRLASVVHDDAVVEALCAVAGQLGILSLRMPLFALRAARAAAALDGRLTIEEADLALAARLVLAPRATRLPTDGAEAPDEAPSPPDQAPEGPKEAEAPTPAELEEVVLAAARAALPPDLLARLATGAGARTAHAPGRSGADRIGGGRGRPIGSRPGDPRVGRLALIDTLRAAAPWQRLRRSLDAPGRTTKEGGPLLAVRRSDLRVKRLVERARSTAIFAVDASGSSAFHRLAEVKGAVELILAEAYARREQVALVAFRGRGAELILPPTRSLARAKRCLAGLPGGGGTPLAAGIDAAADLAESLRRKGETPLVVVLTDGRANIARDGSANRAGATEEALAAARRLKASGTGALLVDTSPQPRPEGAALAAAMNAGYLPLPQAQAGALSRAVLVEWDTRRHGAGGGARA